MKKITAKEWAELWNKALDLAMSQSIPEEIFDTYSRQRLTGFLCDQSFESGRQERRRKKRISGKPTDVIQ